MGWICIYFIHITYLLSKRQSNLTLKPTPGKSITRVLVNLQNILFFLNGNKFCHIQSKRGLLVDKAPKIGLEPIQEAMIDRCALQECTL